MKFTPEEAAAHLRACNKKIRSEIDPVMYHWAMLGRGYAILMSSGPLTYEDRKKRDYPYSKLRPKYAAMTAGDPGVLNIDTGEFVKRWNTKTFTTPFGNSFSITNKDPKADSIVKGMGMAIARPIDKKVEKYVKSQVPNLSRAITQTIEKLYNG